MRTASCLGISVIHYSPPWSEITPNPVAKGPPQSFNPQSFLPITFIPFVPADGVGSGVRLCGLNLISATCKFCDPWQIT